MGAYTGYTLPEPSVPVPGEPPGPGFVAGPATRGRGTTCAVGTIETIEERPAHVRMQNPSHPGLRRRGAARRRPGLRPGQQSRRPLDHPGLDRQCPRHARRRRAEHLLPGRRHLVQHPPSRAGPASGSRKAPPPPATATVRMLGNYANRRRAESEIMHEESPNQFQSSVFGNRSSRRQKRVEAFLHRPACQYSYMPIIETRRRRILVILPVHKSIGIGQHPCHQFK